MSCVVLNSAVRRAYSFPAHWGHRRLSTLPSKRRILLDSGPPEFPDLVEFSSGEAPHYVQVHQITAAWQDWAAVPEGEWQVLAAQVGGTLSARPLPDRAQLPLELLGCFKLRFPGSGAVLESLGGIEGAQEPVRRVGFYSTRYGVLHTWTVRELFRPGTLPGLMGWVDDSLPSSPVEAR